MKVKTYQTRSIQEAVEHIKRDFGPEAMILGTRPVTSRRPWGIRRQRWEVIAGAPEATPAVASSAESPAEKDVRGVPDSVSVTAEPRATTTRPSETSAPTDIAGPAMSEFEAPSRLIRKAEARIEEVLEEIDELKRSVRFLGRAIPQRTGGRSGDIYTKLVGQGVDPELAEKLIASATRPGSTPSKTRDAVRSLLGEMFTIQPPAELEAKERTLSVFVGPTGVGKTTTIAKIAGLAAIRHRKKVALISTDAQRVAGQEQLSRYGQLLGTEVFKCTETGALKEMVESLEEYNLVLIDTPGCSPSDLARLGKLKGGLGGLGARVHLVLSATTKSEDVSKIYKRFQRFSPQSVVLTKMDETETKGAMVGELLRYRLPVSYISDGQHVPEDLMVPRGADLARLMLPVRRRPVRSL